MQRYSPETQAYLSAQFSFTRCHLLQYRRSQVGLSIQIDPEGMIEPLRALLQRLEQDRRSLEPSDRRVRLDGVRKERTGRGIAATPRTRRGHAYGDTLTPWHHAGT